MADEWIGVAEVAAELNVTWRQAAAKVRRMGVRVDEPARPPSDWRFPRSEWVRARDASVAPPAKKGARRPARRVKVASRLSFDDV